MYLFDLLPLRNTISVMRCSVTRRNADRISKPGNSSEKYPRSSTSKKNGKQSKAQEMGTYRSQHLSLGPRGGWESGAEAIHEKMAKNVPELSHQSTCLQIPVTQSGIINKKQQKTNSNC